MIPLLAAALVEGSDNICPENLLQSRIPAV
jgi:hypothetical protein